MIQLYQMPISHYCEKVRWALDHKALPYETVNLLPGFHLRVTRKLAPKTGVPILVDGDRTIQNSPDILSYLDEAYPQATLTPTDDVLRAQVLDFEEMVDRDVGPHVRRVAYFYYLQHPSLVIPMFTANGPWHGPLSMRLLYRPLVKRMRHFMKINPERTADSTEKLSQVIHQIHEQKVGKRYLFGDQLTRADIAAAALLAPLTLPDGYGVPVPSAPPPGLQAFIDAHAEQLAWVNAFYDAERSNVGPVTLG